MELYESEKTLNPFKRMVQDNFKYSFNLKGFRFVVEESGSEFNCYVDGVEFKELVKRKEILVKGKGVDCGESGTLGNLDMETIGDIEEPDIDLMRRELGKLSH